MPNFIKLLLAGAGVVIGSNIGMIAGLVRGVIEFIMPYVETGINIMMSGPVEPGGFSPRAAIIWLLGLMRTAEWLLNRYVEFDRLVSTFFACVGVILTTHVLAFGIRTATRFALHAAAANADINPIP